MRGVRGGQVVSGDPHQLRCGREIMRFDLIKEQWCERARRFEPQPKGLRSIPALKEIHQEEQTAATATDPDFTQPEDGETSGYLK